MNEKHDFPAQKLKDLISSNMLHDVLIELKNFANGQYFDVYNELILHSSNLKDGEKSLSLGIISYGIICQLEQIIR